MFSIKYRYLKLNSFNTTYKVIIFVSRLIKKNRERLYSERVIQRNKLGNTNTGFYIIRRRPTNASIFSNVNYVLQGILRASELKLIPVVNFQDYWTSYSKNYKLCNTWNAWEYFFRPLKEISLNSLTKNDKLIESKGDRILSDHWITDKQHQYIFHKSNLKLLNQLVVEYLVLQPWCVEVLSELKGIIDWDGPNTLGVSVRSTFIEIEPTNEPKQPSLNMLIKKIKKYLELYDFKRGIFFANEDLYARKIIEDEFKFKVISDFRNSAYFKNLLLKKIPNLQTNDNSSIKIFSYLLETYLLSETKSAILGIANGSVFATILNNSRWENPYFFELGTY